MENTTITKEELLTLNILVYDPLFVEYFKCNPNHSLYEWATNTQSNSKIISTILNNKQIFDQMKIIDIDTQSANKNGDQEVVNASVMYNENLIIIYKGTGGDFEWIDNGEGAYSNITDTKQQKEALAYYDKIVFLYANNQQNIYVTGHSKGGNKAQYVGILRGDKIKHVYSFNGQGFNQAFLLKYDDKIIKNKDKLTNICNQYDYINILLYSVAGNTQYIKSSIKVNTVFDLIANLGALHSLTTLYQFKEDSIKINQVASQSNLMINIQKFLNYCIKYMKEEDLRYTISLIINCMIQDQNIGHDMHSLPKGYYERLVKLVKSYTKDIRIISIIHQCILIIRSAIYLNCPLPNLLSNSNSFFKQSGHNELIRDFSLRTRENLLEITNIVNNEEWYDITKWDIFYRVEGLFKGIDIQNHNNNLNVYYQKLVDIHNISTQQINKIFDSVIECDAHFSSELSNTHDVIKKINVILNQAINSFKI